MGEDEGSREWHPGWGPAASCPHQLMWPAWQARLLMARDCFRQPFFKARFLPTVLPNASS